MIIMSKQHGDYDPEQQKWFCSYWMSEEEWLNVHDYSTSSLTQSPDKKQAEKENENEKER
jgi:hypothetical protein